MEETFHLAATHLETLISNSTEGSPKIKENDLLYLYARYKQVTVGPCNIPRPSFIHVTARRKWSCWNTLKDLSQMQAMEEYIKKVKSLDASWEPKATKVRSGMGVSVSVMDHDEPALEDDDKDIFDWCKEGSLEKVTALLPHNPIKDNEGRTLLHWACDRGHLELVKYLVSKGQDINCEDNDFSTPLHYACSCDHYDITEFLLQHNANPYLKDADNETPLQCTTSEKIKALLDGFATSDLHT